MSVLLRLFSTTLLTLLLALFALPTSARDITVTKAQFLTNLALYVDWPADAFASRSAPFRFCTVGAEDVGAALMWVNTGKKIHGRAVKVQEIESSAQAQGCHIVFVSGLNEENIVTLAGQFVGAHVLSVGDSDAFAEHGGVMGFEMIDGKIQFSINRAAAQREQLKVNAKLMKLGRVL